jgi:rod shape-determining protein MreC
VAFLSPPSRPSPLASARRGHGRLRLALLVLVSLTLIALSLGRSGPATGMRSVFATVFRPVRSASDTVLRPVTDSWHGIRGYDDVRRENARLRDRLSRARGETMSDRLLRQQVTELRRLLDIRFTRDLPTLTARVVSGPLSNFDRTLQIDRGRGDGVKKGMAVVTPAGLAGRVVRLDAARSVVELLTDPSFAVGVQVRPVGALGIAHGSGMNRPLEVEGIAGATPIRRGNDVYTSGVDRSAFPPDVPIGTVTSVRRTGDRSQLVLRVAPVADLGSLTYVKVIIRDPQ